jgi:hypothetical protein
MSLQKNIKDLIYFYVKTNYNQYLEDQEIKIISEDKINSVIENLYDNRKEHLKKFIKESLQIMLKDEYPGDLVILNILLDIFSDDTLCKNRLLVEIKLHQQTLLGKTDYTKLM